MGKVLWDIAIQPIVYLIEFVYAGFWYATSSPGFAIIGVSIMVNLLCLPLYKMADEAQERERLKQKSMERWVSHIRRTFHGDEQYMMLSAYYAEQGYRPVRALVSSLSLVLQIPFFMAAYSYLSQLSLLNGSSFLFLPDLGAPDGLITLGGTTINLMPILMTLLNCASTAVYTRGRPLRDKVQAYVLAVLFLVLLYDSPSGLVFYWTCNQLFSLGKNVVMGALARRRAASEAEAAAKSAADAASPEPAELPADGIKRTPFVSGLARRLRLLVPRRPLPTSRAVALQFVLAGLLLTLLIGVLIPSAVVADSPTEFVDLQAIDVSPLSHVLHAACVCAGTFLLWCGIYFALSRGMARWGYACTLFSLCGVCLMNYFFFGLGHGTISNELVYDNALGYDVPMMVLNTVLTLVVFNLLAVVWLKANKLVAPVLGVTALALAVVAAPNLFSTAQAYGELRAQVKANEELAQAAAADAANSALDAHVEDVERRYGSNTIDADYGVRSSIASTDGAPLFHLSTTERNVVVIFLDRAISGYLPYIMHERPELAGKFDGFTYYPNTISFGTSTNFGAPALYGGYEYSPAAMNARDTERIADKHNEALLVLPTLFSEAGYQSTVVDPPYAGNYRWYPDLSMYEGLSNVSAYYNDGGFLPEMEERYDMKVTVNIDRQFFCYGLFQVMPEVMQLFFYDNGKYHSTADAGAPSRSVMEQYSVLLKLPELSEASPGPGGFVQLANTMTHEPDLLQLPDYLPAAHINNQGLEDMSRFTLNGRTVLMDTHERLIHYHANAGALLRLGEWFDWMREQGVYDNTKIIVVSDHGRYLYQFADWTIDEYLDIEMVNPLFMVKDFDAHGFTTSDEFMTNADAAVMAAEGSIADPVNPFTGVALDDAEKHAHDQLVTASQLWVAPRNNGTTFDTSDAPWYTVHDNIFDLSNWERLEQDGDGGLAAAINGLGNRLRNGAQAGGTSSARTVSETSAEGSASNQAAGSASAPAASGAGSAAPQSSTGGERQ